MRGARGTGAALLLLAALLAAGCVPRGMPVTLVNDTDTTIIVEPLTAQSVKEITFAPGARQTVHPLSTGTIGYRLRNSAGTTGCLRVVRQPVPALPEVLLFSNASADCPTVPLADVFHAALSLSHGFTWLQLLGYVLAPLAAGVWIVQWARRMPGKSLRLALLECGGLCLFSAALLAALLHWGVPGS